MTPHAIGGNCRKASVENTAMPAMLPRMSSR